MAKNPNTPQIVLIRLAKDAFAKISIPFGVIARIIGAFIALNLTKSELNNREKLFIGISTLGKATIQATLAPLVVAAGINNSHTILAIAVMSILVTAPAATIANE